MRSDDEKAIHKVLGMLEKGLRADYDNLSIEQAYEKTYWGKWRGNKDADRAEKQAEVIMGILGKGRPVASVNGNAVEYLMNELRHRGLTGATVNRYLANLKTMMRYVKAHHQHDLVIPPIQVQLKYENNRTRLVSPEEERLLIEHADTELSDFLAIMMQTGMRNSEILRLNFEDGSVNIQGRAITIKKSKAGKPRTIPASKKVMEILKRRKKAGQRMVFSISQFQINREFRELKKTLGIVDPDLTPYACRHTAATRLLESGVVDSFLVSKMLGHSSLKTTEKYLHLTSKSLEKCTDVFDKM